MSEYIFIRVKKTGGWDINNVDHVDAAGKHITLNSEIITAIPNNHCKVACNGTECKVIFDDPLTAPETTTLNTVVAAHKAVVSLTNVKNIRIQEIDDKTGELIKVGFTFDGKIFSLSMYAQSKMMGAHQIKDDPALVYPITWNTKNDLATVVIDNAVELNAFYLTGVGTVRAAIDSGTVLKDQIRVANTQGAIDLVIDNR